jgi:hypothetical protein
MLCLFYVLNNRQEHGLFYCPACGESYEPWKHMPSDQYPNAHYGGVRIDRRRDLRRVPVNKCVLMKQKDAAGDAVDGVHVMLSHWDSTNAEKLMDRIKLVTMGLSEGMASEDPIQFFAREIGSLSPKSVCSQAWIKTKMTSVTRTYVEGKNLHKPIRLDLSQDANGDIWFEYIQYKWTPETRVMSEDEVLQTLLLLQTEMFAPDFLVAASCHFPSLVMDDSAVGLTWYPMPASQQ